jgi:hypothetical protein
MRWQAIAPIGSGKDKQQTAAHQEEHARAAVFSIAAHNCETADPSYRYGKSSVNPLLRGQVMRPYG